MYDDVNWMVMREERWDYIISICISTQTNARFSACLGVGRSGKTRTNSLAILQPAPSTWCLTLQSTWCPTLQSTWCPTLQSNLCWDTHWQCQLSSQRWTGLGLLPISLNTGSATVQKYQAHNYKAYICLLLEYGCSVSLSVYGAHTAPKKSEP